MVKKPIEVLLTNPWRKRMAGSLPQRILNESGLCGLILITQQIALEASPPSAYSVSNRTQTKQFEGISPG